MSSVAHSAASGYRLTITSFTPPDDQRELDEFISLISHDLRTPLTSIRGYAQLLLRQRRNQPEDATAESLQIIVRETDRLDEMTAALLDISRVRVGRVPLRPERVNLAAALQKVMAELGHSSAPLDGPEEPAVVTADAKRVSQVLRAVGRYLDERGGAVSAGLSHDDERVHLVLEDDGDSLAPAELQRLFGALIESAPDAPSGWRIGRPDLYIARGLAEAHGGSLRAESPVSGSARGVRFTLSLPLDPA